MIDVTIFLCYFYSESTLHAILSYFRMDTDLFKAIEAHQWPIVYHPRYNIRLLGLEKMHPFDSQKWGHIFEVVFLCTYKCLKLTGNVVYKFVCSFCRI